MLPCSKGGAKKCTKRTMFYHSLALLEVIQSLNAKKNPRWILKQTDIYLKPWGLSLLFYAGDREELCVLCQHLSWQKLLICSGVRSHEESKNSNLFVWDFFLYYQLFNSLHENWVV